MKSSLRPGTAVTSNVRLVRPLNEGAMGTLWVADHLTLDTEVVVKFVHARLASRGQEADQRFEREAKAAAKIKSPHVVQIFDYGRMGDGTAYMVMEMLDGESLAARLRRTGWLSFGQCGEVVHQICRALHAANQLSIVHRDVKPDNIFLCPSDDGIFVKLVDFGIATDRSPSGERKLTHPGNLIGSTEYLCRDQIVRASDANLQTDLWGLAVVAYEMLTGDVPFTGETTGAICVAIANATVGPPSELRKGVPKEVDAWFARALHRDPAERFESPRAFAAAFRGAITSALRTHDESTDAALREPSSRRNATTLDGIGPQPADDSDAFARVSDRPVGATLSSAPHLPLQRRSRWALVGTSLAAVVLGVIFVAHEAADHETEGLWQPAPNLSATSAPLSAKPVEATAAPREPTEPPRRTATSHEPLPISSRSVEAEPAPTETSPTPTKAPDHETEPTAVRPDYGF